jgi:hypothetical protein
MDGIENIDDMVKTMHEMHKITTLSQPLIMHVWTIKDGLNKIPKNLNVLTKKCFKRFKKTSLKYTTIDSDPI